MTWEIRRSPEDAWETLVLAAVEDSTIGPTPGMGGKYSGTSDTLRGLGSFELRTPRIVLAGRSYASVTTRFPEGNHR